MKLAIVLLGIFVVANGAMVGEERKHEKKEHRSEEEEEFTGELDEQTKHDLIFGKKEHVLYASQIEFFLNNPNTKRERECFAKLKPDQSIQFIVDIAPSPTKDELDKMLAESPMALFSEQYYRSPSRAYFGGIQFLIDAVTIDMKPEATCSVIYEKGRRFCIRGRDVENVEWVNRLKQGGRFDDKARNLKTLWPVATKEVMSYLKPIVSNGLGRLTKLALWNRDNGVPVVLENECRSKPVYTVVISDGWSQARINDFGVDLSRTTVIDIGNHRFVKQLDWNTVKQIKGGVYTLTTPQQLPLMYDTIRNMACCFVENSVSSM